MQRQASATRGDRPARVRGARIATVHGDAPAARCWCIVPAAGVGARFGADRPKQYVELLGRPLLAWTLERLAASPAVAGLVVVLAQGDRWWPELGALVGKPVLTAIGGATRADSVLAGLAALPRNVDEHAFVLVHDAARPCVRTVDIERLVVLGAAAGGALLACPLHDTLKRAGSDGRVDATEPRDARWRALTPQLFRRGELTRALEAARNEGVDITDESMAMERGGHRPLLVEGGEGNLKVTTAADMVLAELLLSRAQIMQ